jgi:hypothetical protein
VFEVTAVQVPVGDVVLRVAHDRTIGYEPRREIEPALVDEEALQRIDSAVVQEALAPPPQQRVRLLARAERDVTEVVDTREQDVDLARALAVIGERHRVVRREHDRVRARQLVEVLERAEDPDVRVEVRDRPVALTEQVRQQPRLDRRRELQDRVAQGHLLELGAADLLWSEDRERLLRGVDVAFVLVDRQDEARPLGMPLRE